RKRATCTFFLPPSGYSPVASLGVHDPFTTPRPARNGQRGQRCNPGSPSPVEFLFRQPRRLFALRVAMVFPGQGTQSPAMGQPWKGQPAWSVVERAESALGEPLAPLLLDADADDLARTRNSQLSVLLTSLMVW